MLVLDTEEVAIEWAAPLTIVTPELERMVRRYVTALSRDPASVDDLAQEVFFRAIERSARISVADDVGRFLRGIARNVVREHFRAGRRDQRYVQATLANMATQGDPIAKSCAEKDMLGSLRRELEELPLVSRRLVEMRYHDGRSSAEIGKAIGMSPEAVRVTLLRIRQRLRQRLDR